MKRSHRMLPVILNEDVEGIGFKGSLVNVRAGFARNYLMPGKLAAIATESAKQDRAKEISAAKERHGEETASREELAKQLSEEAVQLELKVGPAGQVFGAITAVEFAKALKAQRKLEVDPKQLHGLPLSALGPGQVSARLGLGVTAQIPANVKGGKTSAAKSSRQGTATSKT